VKTSTHDLNPYYRQGYLKVSSLSYKKVWGQYLSVKGKRGRGKGKEKTFNLYPLTFSLNPIPS
jgi:hypothetical protein